MLRTVQDFSPGLRKCRNLRTSGHPETPCFQAETALLMTFSDILAGMRSGLLFSTFSQNFRDPPAWVGESAGSVKREVGRRSECDGKEVGRRSECDGKEGSRLGIPYVHPCIYRMSTETPHVTPRRNDLRCLAGTIPDRPICGPRSPPRPSIGCFLREVSQDLVT